MILNILASLALAIFICRDAVGTVVMLQSPYESKGKWLVLSLLQIAGLLIAMWAVWS